MCYYICPSCGELTFDEEIDEDISVGGMGLCGCEYMDLVWDHEIKDFEPIYYKFYTAWVQISESIYEKLSKVDNDVIRLKMFGTIQREDLL